MSSDTIAEVRATHHYAFRSGEWAVILGVRMVDPGKGLRPRPCYLVAFPDGAQDLWPVDDADHGYEFRAWVDPEEQA